MDINEFFAVADVSLVPVFRLTRDVTVQALTWRLGSSPKLDKDPVEITLTAGTLLRRTAYSNFGDGHSMEPLDVKATLGNMKDRQHKWFRVNYADMEYVYSIVSNARLEHKGAPIVIKMPS